MSNINHKTEAYTKIQNLVNTFRNFLPQYKSGQFNETQTRIQFVNPFWEALGWDMDNKQQLPPQYIEVVHEARQKVGGKSKAPDYCFQKQENYKFFYLETKKPAVNIKDDESPALQLRKYGWNGKLKISILTDFEEFAIYNCTKKPKENDTAKVARLEYFTFEDYLTRFDFIYDVFAKINVMNGSLNQYAKNKKEINENETVDKDFLKTLEQWRNVLATNIALNNPLLEDFQLNYSVQQIIDRILFLKIAEDRNIEPTNQLRDVAKKGKVYENIFMLFREADQRYNSGLFDFKKDALTPTLKIDNKVLKENIIKELYDNYYDFSIIPVEILGYVYEQFLGKVIVYNPLEKAKTGEKIGVNIQEKPEVRKAGGVFYTPQYIVDYIVENTIGKWIKNKTPEQITKLKIVDPSCGSGSFLLGAYNYLLLYHLDYYQQNPPKQNGKNYQIITPEGTLSTVVKKQILLNNIFGVDIDDQAVEVTKLSLLIKCLENETLASVKNQMGMFKERVLPTLDHNILCGNSLVSPDFYEGSLFLTAKEQRKVNVFDWKQGFPNVFKEGGFDIVIGNPPYGANFGDEVKKYVKNHYPTSDIELESYLLFIEKAIYLLKTEGLLGYIIPNNLFTNVRYNKTRELILKTSIEKLLDLGSNVFNQASVDTCLLIFNKLFKDNNIIKTFIGSLNSNSEPVYKAFEQNKFASNGNKIFNIYSSLGEKDLEKKIESNDKVYLITLVKFARGVEYGYTSQYTTNKAKTKNAKPLIAGRCIGRFSLKFENKYVIYDETDLSNFKDKVIYESPKILMRRIGQEIIATFDEAKYYNVCDVYNLLAKNGTDLKYILGILNSKLMSFYLKTKFKNAKKIFPKIPIQYLEQLPIKTLNLKTQTEKQQHDKMVQLVEDMLVLQENLQQALTPQSKEQIQRIISYKDDQINTLVYQLYDLSAEDIDLIENTK